MGELLSRVLESESLETLSLTGGAAAVLAGIELGMAALVMAIGAARVLNLVLFALWLAVVGIFSWRYGRRRKEWMLRRNGLTHDLVEKMNGHRTRIAQQPAALWHREEDRDVLNYLRSSRSMDRLHACLTAIGPRGWLALGMAAVGFEFVTGSATPEAVAIATGGVLLGYQALRRFVFGVGQLTGAWQSWETVRDLFDAAAQNETNAPDAGIGVVASEQVLDARDWPTPIRGATGMCCGTARCAFARVIAFCSREPRAAASRHSELFWPGCGGRPGGCSCPAASIGPLSVRRAGVNGSPRRLSITKTTSWPRRCHSTF